MVTTIAAIKRKCAAKVRPKTTHDPMYKEKRENLKKRLSALRKKVGDDGQDFPKTEDVIKEFWDYDADDREKARKISGEFLERRLTELKNPKGKKN